MSTQRTFAFNPPGRKAAPLVSSKHDEANKTASSIILSDIAKFGGEQALAVQWARSVAAHVAADAAIRPRRTGEVFHLDCRCGASIEVPVRGPHRCDFCGHQLEIQWEAARV